MLSRVGGFGTPLEYYYPYDFEKRKEHWHSRKIEHAVDTELKWVQEVLNRQALKCTWDAYQKFLEEAGELKDNIQMKYIYLKRRDKFRQAISWQRAIESDRWTSLEPQKSNPEYNREKIATCLEWINQYEEKWEKYLEDVDHLKLEYENLSYMTIETIEKFTGRIRERELELDSNHTIMRDDLTEDWISRFNNENNVTPSI
jgi:LPS sulfotransferase NodH